MNSRTTYLVPTIFHNFQRNQREKRGARHRRGGRKPLSLAKRQRKILFRELVVARRVA